MNDIERKYANKMNDVKEIENRVYDIKEIADIYKIKIDTLRKMIKRKSKYDCYLILELQKFIISKTSNKILLIPVNMNVPPIDYDQCIILTVNAIVKDVKNCLCSECSENIIKRINWHKAGSCFSLDLKQLNNKINEVKNDEFNNGKNN